MAANEKPQEKPAAPAEPRGFGEHSRGLGSEYAHEQGWELNIEERTKLPQTPQNTFGGNDYDYGARDFGDQPVNTEIAPQQPNQILHPSSSAETPNPDKETE